MMFGDQYGWYVFITRENARQTLIEPREHMWAEEKIRYELTGYLKYRTEQRGKGWFRRGGDRVSKFSSIPTMGRPV